MYTCRVLGGSQWQFYHRHISVFHWDVLKRCSFACWITSDPLLKMNCISVILFLESHLTSIDLCSSLPPSIPSFLPSFLVKYSLDSQSWSQLLQLPKDVFYSVDVFVIVSSYNLNFIPLKFKEILHKLKSNSESEKVKWKWSCSVVSDPLQPCGL